MLTLKLKGHFIFIRWWLGLIELNVGQCKNNRTIEAKVDVAKMDVWSCRKL